MVRLARIRVYFNFLFYFLGGVVYAQTPWGGSYGNEWLANKFEQSWLKISVNKQGVQRVKLPEAYQNKVGQLHLYHRGVEISMLRVSSAEIEFYGVLNDGASDALLYRPYTGYKLNPYYSWYSDESSYFLTISNSTGSKLAVTQVDLALSGVPEPYHIQRELKLYTDADTYDGSQNLVFHTLDHSYLIEGKGRSSQLYYKRTGDNPSGDPTFVFPFKFQNLVRSSDTKSLIEVLFNGRTFAKNSIKASIGKTGTSLKDYPNLVEFSDFIALKKDFSVDPNIDLDEEGQGQLQLQSTIITDQSSSTGIFSVNYTRLVYPQTLDMIGTSTAVFNLVPTANNTSNVRIANVPEDAKVYDITVKDAPRIIPGSWINGDFQLMVERVAGQELNLLVSNEINIIENDRLSSVSFQKIDPAEYDYLIVTNDLLWDAANEYAAYRKSIEGGGFRTLTIKIKDIYNQFNNGEPSPVALRRFVDFMVHNSPRTKHNLLLIGPSTSISAKLAINREIPGDVPAIGFPGSDVLLVEGLTPDTKDIPSIPVGRINATLPDQVKSYLSKVIYYEQNQQEFLWKKRVLHLNGGKSAAEINQFKTFLEGLIPTVENGEVGGNVTAKVKQSTIEVEKANVSSNVNEGLGLISYMGHGDPTVTDFDLGYVSDASNSYQNYGKYPLMYFNGCGVGNIFNGRNNPSPNATDRLPQSSDWINTKDKGALAIIANSYYSFQASSSKYLEALYASLFGSAGSSDMTIGQILEETAKSVKLNNFNEYDLANIHQSLLQGDPSLRLIREDKPDFSIKEHEGILVLSESANKSIGESTVLRIGVVISNGGKYIKNQTFSGLLTEHFSDGTTSTLNVTIPSISFQDTLYIETANKKEISKIEFIIDPSNLIAELLEDNNTSTLIVDWEKAKDLSQYPVSNGNDNIAPLLYVTFNNEKIKDGSTISRNPIIDIWVYDDRELAVDTTLVDLYIRNCVDGNCDFKRISYGQNDMNLSQVGEGGLDLKYTPSDLIDGSYELMAVARDMAGNVSEQTMAVRFVISDQSAKSNLVVSPNPASDYIRFELSNINDGLNKVRVIIYDIRGNAVTEKNIEPLISNWYWIPKGNNPGLYIYKVIVSKDDDSQTTYTGKFVLN